ncbi:MAG: hypothetical protein U0441_34245 [Polyangiaceae bacterium]
MIRRALRAAYLVIVCAVLALSAAPPRAATGWFEVAAEVAGQAAVAKIAPSRNTDAPHIPSARNQRSRQAVASSTDRRLPFPSLHDAATGALPRVPVPAPTPALALYITNSSLLC